MKNLFNLIAGSFCIIVGLWDLSVIPFLSEDQIFKAFVYLVLGVLVLFVGWVNFYIWKYDKSPKLIEELLDRVM